MTGLTTMWLSIVGFLVGVLLINPFSWKRARYMVTLIHETGHALFGSLTGGQLVGVVVNLDSSGETLTRHKRGISSTLFSIIPTLLAGYPAPLFFGVLGAGFGFAGWVHAGWIIFAFAGLICMLFARGFFTIILGALFVSLSLLGVGITPWGEPFSVEVSTFLLLMLSGLLIAGACKDMVELTRMALMGLAENSDPDFLKQRTRVGTRTLWVFVLWGCLLVAGVIAGLSVYYFGDELEKIAFGLTTLIKG